MKKFLKIAFVILVILGIVYITGPAPEKPVYEKTLPVIETETALLDNYIKSQEASFKTKPGNEATIVWANDSLKQKTDYAIVYLHGFTASHEEGSPVHKNIAQKFGCNLYLSRLAGHGLETTEPFADLTAEQYWQSAKDALAVGKKLGSKIILMGTSTGGTNALQLAAAYPEEVAALILYSPNIRIKDPNAWIANNHWGLQLGKLIMKGDYVSSKDQRDIYKKYWYSRYRLEGVVAVQEMLETSMINETFEKITQPTLLLYYYKDDKNQDAVVDVKAMLKMFDELKTPADKKMKMAMPLTGDHVIGSYIKSKDLDGVQRETAQFLQQVLKLQPMN